MQMNGKTKSRTPYLNFRDECNEPNYDMARQRHVTLTTISNDGLIILIGSISHFFRSTRVVIIFLNQRAFDTRKGTPNPDTVVESRVIKYTAT
jgi:hypothetical protein